MAYIKTGAERGVSNLKRIFRVLAMSGASLARPIQPVLLRLYDRRQCLITQGRTQHRVDLRQVRHLQGRAVHLCVWRVAVQLPECSGGVFANRDLLRHSAALWPSSAHVSFWLTEGAECPHALSRFRARSGVLDLCERPKRQVFVFTHYLQILASLCLPMTGIQGGVRPGVANFRPLW